MDNDNLIEFSDYLIDYCDKKNITAYELSKLSHVSMTYCYKMLRGEMTNPSIRIMRQLGMGLNIRYEEYLNNVKVY